MDRKSRLYQKDIGNNKSYSIIKSPKENQYKINNLNKQISISPGRNIPKPSILLKNGIDNTVLSNVGKYIIMNNNILSSSIKQVNGLDLTSNKKKTKDRIDLDIKFLKKEIKPNQISHQSEYSQNGNDNIKKRDNSWHKESNMNLNVTEDLIEITTDASILKENLSIIDLILDLELLSDSKNSINQIANRILSMHESCLTNKENEKLSFIEKMTSQKIYHKLMKIQMIVCILIKYIHSDFNYESNLKSHLKRLFNLINEPLILLIENLIIGKIEGNDYSLIEKIKIKVSQLSKSHKSSKNIKEKDIFISVFKQLDLIISNIKQFSK